MVSTLFFISWVFSCLATIVNSNLQHRTKGIEKGITQFWIRISGFELQGANHCTIEPNLVQDTLTLCEVPSLVGFCSLFVKINVSLLIGFFVFFRLVVSLWDNIFNSDLQHGTTDFGKTVLPWFELGP